MDPNSTTVWLASAPARPISVDPPEVAAARGTVLLYHGFTACKDDQLRELESLARAGFLAIGIDAVGHGERRSPELDRSFEGESGRDRLLELVTATVEEVPSVLDALTERGWAVPGRMGIGGISMGGYVTYGVLATSARFAAATPILGSPEWPGSVDSPHRRADRFPPTALLSQNAGRDRNVPFHAAQRLHRQLTPHYAHHPERLRFELYPESDHFMRPDDWELLWSRVVDWYRRFLA